MRCLTNSETRQWLTGQGMRHQPMDCGVPLAGNFEISEKHQGCVTFADYLVDLLSKNGNKLVEILPGPQPSPEEGRKMEHFRASLGEVRPLAIASAHLFKSADREEFRTMMLELMGSQNAWSFYIYAAPSRTALLIQGQRIAVWAHKKGVCNELERYLMPSEAA